MLIFNIVLYNLIILFLLILGTLAIFSANNFFYIKVYKQIIFLIISIILYYFISFKFRLEYIEKISLPFYIFTVLILILNLFIGKVVNGSKGWIYIGSFSFQPAELSKLALIFIYYTVFKYLNENINNKEINSIYFQILFFIITGLVTLFLIIFIIIQPDLGFSALLFFTFLLTNLGLKINPIFIIITLALTIFTGKFIIKPYQLERLLTFLDPYKDPLGSGWQVINSVNAIINGGLSGLGFNKAELSKIGFLPENDTDFIFSFISEEFGLIGSSIIILSFLILLFSMLITYINLKKTEEKLIVIFVSSLLFLQSFENIGMCVMATPVTGLPLPLISYGGTNLVITIFLLALVNNLNFLILKREKINKWNLLN
jgi:cell division protein FtsW (lipid II flippase)